MDKSAPWTVLYSSLGFTAFGATTTGVLGILQGKEHYGTLAARGAFGWGVTATMFFSFREFVVSPVLVYSMPWEQYDRPRRELGIGPPPTPGSGTAPSGSPYDEIRNDKVLDSGVSGGVVGGALHAWIKGSRPAVLFGTIFYTITCGLAQRGFNECRVQRLKFISQQRSPKVDSSPTTNAGQVMEGTEEPTPWRDKLLALLGVNKISDEEYLMRLKLQRDHCLARIKMLEQKLEDEKKAK